MTESEQRITIAEACGWQRINNHADDLESLAWLSPTGKVTPGGHWVHLPDYLKDLNAMHEAEKILNPCRIGTGQHGHSDKWYDFVLKLGEIIEQESEGKASNIHATASQRAEAFLRTIGKWKE